MSVLGINDSHDSGSALSSEGKAVCAANEERFTKNKNEVGFPYNALRYTLANSDTGEIQAIALGWIGGNALVSRVLPSWDKRRRSAWRKETPKQSRLGMHAMNFVYRLVQDQEPRALWRAVGTPLSSMITRRRLKHLSPQISEKKIYVVEHHLAHASGAYYSSGFKEALVITLDGAGDGLSGTVSIGENGTLKRLAEFKASSSIGILYGASTVACDMRYGEDEGKLMSLAAYSYPAEIKELDGICRYDESKKRLVSKMKTRNELLLAEYLKDHVLSRRDRESFAYAVQAHVEKQVASMVRQWISETGIRNLAVSGGFFSNVITNMRLEHMPEVKNMFIFPHMGDGGLSLGAAAYVDFMLNGKFSETQMSNAYLGPAYSNDEIEETLKGAAPSGKFEYERIEDPARYGAELIADENRILLWFQGGMEYGPRALGNRSVLALPSEEENRNRINLIIKQRPYYQPFASSILEEDAPRIFEDYVRQNRFMTSANNVRKEFHKTLVAAAHIDHTTRPQMVGKENQLYRDLLLNVKKRTGIGAVLNTSLNKHGKPIAMTPKDALWTLENTGADTLMLGNFMVTKKGA